MRPSKANFFEWDDDNERELAAHHITSEEVEQVFRYNHPLWARNKQGRSANWIMVGVTLGGRLLTVAILHKEADDALRAITGWDADEGERTQYFRNRRR